MHNGITQAGMQRKTGQIQVSQLSDSFFLSHSFLELISKMSCMQDACFYLFVVLIHPNLLALISFHLHLHLHLHLYLSISLSIPLLSHLYSPSEMCSEYCKLILLFSQHLLLHDFYKQ